METVVFCIWVRVDDEGTEGVGRGGKKDDDDDEDDEGGGIEGV
jgi:hypothetical protein